MTEHHRDALKVLDGIDLDKKCVLFDDLGIFFIFVKLICSCFV
jgi:hypothetical protein